MEFKKFTTYEFEVVYDHPDGDGEPLTKDVMYKVNENNDALSVVSFEANGQKVTLPAALLKEIGKAMQEVNPFDFAFGD
jgi:hypothetical protein